MYEYLSHQPLIKNSSKHDAHSHHHEHAHTHDHHDHVDAREMDKKILKISLFMTASMMIVQFIYSLLSNSLALLSDTLHMFSDVFALSLSFLAILAVQKFKNSQKTFGYFRLEILVAFINALTIIFSAIFIIYESVYRLFYPGEIDALTMIIVAIFGFLVNAFNGFLMFKGANLENINMKSAFLHMMSDLLGSLFVIVGGILVYFTHFVLIDTILALILSFLLLRWSVKLLKQSVDVLLESSPIEIEKVENKLLEFKEIEKIIDLHVTQITHKMYVATMHLKISKDEIQNFRQISRKIARILRDEFEIGHCTIEPIWEEKNEKI